jgi:putative cardiolipin synthase
MAALDPPLTQVCMPTFAPYRSLQTIASLWWRRLRGAVAALAVVCAGCAQSPAPPLPTAEHALAPRAESPFAAAEDDIRRRHGEGVSGFRLLHGNLDALTWRLAVIDSARHSLDLQYYVWFGDKVGQLLLARVVAAADRGVRVRLLFDDLNTLLHDMGHVELRDAMLSRIDRHPNLEIRVFNGWRERGLVGRAAEAAWDFERLNRRMHNKQMVADNRVAIIGGRNIGDEYFGLHPAFNFLDLDVLGVGPVARQASEVFDRYWNSGWVRGIPRQPAVSGPAETSAAELEAFAQLATDSRAREVLAGQRSWSAEIASLPAALLPGRSAVHTDSPSRAADVRNHMPEAFRSLLLSARREVLITNAYIIPDAVFLEDLRALGARGVQVHILTNSLASHDVPAVNSHYEAWRRPILETGARLHELRPDAAVKTQLVDTAPVSGRFVGLHTKAMVIDRERSFIGSMNLDPRSEVINAEMGVLVDSEPLARALAAAMERDMGGANSWRVELDAGGALRWTSDAGTLDRQPARNGWQRIENLVFKLFPPSLY